MIDLQFKEVFMKTIARTFLVLGLFLGACQEGAAAPTPDSMTVSGVDGGLSDSTTVDVGAEVPQGAEAGGADCHTTTATTFGNACLLRVPSGVACETARLFVDGIEANPNEFTHTCGGSDPQIMVSGGACSRLESHAVASIGCL